jgi:hypothetical protein
MARKLVAILIVFAAALAACKHVQTGSGLLIEDDNYPMVLEIHAIALGGIADANIRAWQAVDFVPNAVPDLPPTKTKHFPAYEYASARESYTLKLSDWAFICGAEYKGKCAVTLHVGDLRMARNHIAFLKTWELKAEDLPIKQKAAVEEMPLELAHSRSGVKIYYKAYRLFSYPEESIASNACTGEAHAFCTSLPSFREREACLVGSERQNALGRCKQCCESKFKVNASARMQECLPICDDLQRAAKEWSRWKDSSAADADPQMPFDTWYYSWGQNNGYNGLDL